MSDHSVLAIAPELARLPSGVLGQRLCQMFSAAGSHLVVSRGARVSTIMAIDGLRSEWASDYGILSSASVAWPVAFPLARAMAAGVWYGDVSVKHRRQLPTEVTMAPLAPPAGLLRHWLLAVQDRPKPPEKAREENDLVYDKVSGCVRRFHPEHIIATLRAGQYVQNKAKVEDTLVNSHRFWYPSKRRFPPGHPVDRKVPHADTQRRNVVRIDSASMLARRAWYKVNGPTYRYIAYDASPQRGHEYFASVERVVRRAALAAAADDTMPEVESRLLPLAILGSARMGLAEKTQAHIHQTWLEYGPSVADVRLANMDVRQCLSDMGAEMGICDAADVLPQCLGQPEPSSSPSPDDARAIVCASPDDGVAHLFPLALAVPGPQHIIDTATQRGLETLPWWPDWQRSAKVVCQWLRSPGRRRQLQERLRAAGGEQVVVEGRCKAMDLGCDGFAEWRWKTISKVTEDLLRLREPVVVALQSVIAASDLSTRDAATASAFVSSARDPQFWSRAEGLATLVRPMAALSSWIRGCDCHERERLAGSAAQCDWQGCRARGLAARVDRCLAQIAEAREAFEGADMVRAATSMLASLDNKLDWLKHEPYLVWQAVC